MHREADLEELKQLKDLEDAVDRVYSFMVKKHREHISKKRSSRNLKDRDRPSSSGDLYNLRVIEEKMSKLGHMKKMVSNMRGIRYVK